MRFFVRFSPNRRRAFWSEEGKPLHLLPAEDLECMEQRRDLGAPGGSDWPQDLPVKKAMSSENFQITLARRLRQPARAQDKCFPGCSKNTDALGDHDVSLWACGPRYRVVSLVWPA